MTSETRADHFYKSHVLPSISDWLKRETEIHLAMTVATNLAHMADYYWYSFHTTQPEKTFLQPDLTAFRAEMGRRYPDFALIRDICDAHKHLKISRRDRCITSAGQSTLGSLGCGESDWGEAEWGSPTEVVVTDDYGTKHHFRALVKNTLTMWEILLRT